MTVMTRGQVEVGPVTIGPGQALAVIAGPCVLEDEATNREIATTLVPICEELGLSFIFKASFDKANRSSLHSARGPGLEAGLRELAAIRREIDAPITTDVHDPAQAAPVAEIVDLLQVPAFLCRQTDLLAACAATGRPVNVKKGQFMAPIEMTNVITKLREGGCTSTILTERGTFFGYHRLVNDFAGLGDLMALGAPVCFDVTHSMQFPGGQGQVTGGQPQHAPRLARAAVAAGVDAVFIECHPEPSRALSDASTQLRLDEMAELLRSLARIRAVVEA